MIDAGTAAALALSPERDGGVVGRRGAQTSDGIVDTVPPIENDFDGGVDTFFDQELVEVHLLHSPCLPSIHYSQESILLLAPQTLRIFNTGHSKKAKRCQQGMNLSKVRIQGVAKTMQKA